MKTIYKRLIKGCILSAFSVFFIHPVHALTNDVVTPEQFGANGTDKIADTKALQQAFDTSTNVVLKENVTYYIDKPLTVDHSISITTTGGKANIVKTTLKTGENAFHFVNEETAHAIMYETAKKGQNFLVVSRTTGMHVGDLVHLKSSRLWTWDNRGYLSKGELLRVNKIVGNTLYFETPLQDSYYTSGEKVDVSSFADKKVTINNVSFSYPQPFNANKELVRIDMTTNASLQGIEVKNSTYLGLLLERTYKTKIKDAYVDLNTTPDIKTGYGIQDYGGLYTNITNSYFTNVRRGVDFSGTTPSRFGYVGYSTAVGSVKNTLNIGNSGFGTHSTAENIIFEYNKVTNFDYSFVSRGNYITVRNNEATGDVLGFVVARHGDHLSVYNNTFAKGKAEHFIVLMNPFNGTVKVRNNYMSILSSDFLFNTSSNVRELHLEKNRVYVSKEGTTYAYLIRSWVPLALKNSTLTENKLNMISGQKSFVRNIDVSSKTNAVDYSY